VFPREVFANAARCHIASLLFESSSLLEKQADSIAILSSGAATMTYPTLLPPKSHIRRINVNKKKLRKVGKGLNEDLKAARTLNNGQFTAFKHNGIYALEMVALSRIKEMRNKRTNTLDELRQTMKTFEDAGETRSRLYRELGKTEEILVAELGKWRDLEILVAQHRPVSCCS